jgi:hypothetical protein
MKAIIFDKMHRRKETIIDSATEFISDIMTDSEVAYKIIYKLQMYDMKGRPIYVEFERNKITVEKGEE